MSEAASAVATAWVVLGAGGHARAVADVIRRRGERVLAVSGVPDLPWDVEVLSDDATALAHALEHGASVALAIGDGAVRVHLLDRALAAGLRVPPLVATTATVAADAVLAEGVVVLEHAHVGPLARVGRAALVNTAAVVEHDVVVGVGAHVAPAAVVLGGAAAGDHALVGSGARVLPLVRVGAGAVVGAGSVVREDVEPGRTVVGVPARPHRG